MAYLQFYRLTCPNRMEMELPRRVDRRKEGNSPAATAGEYLLPKKNLPVKFDFSTVSVYTHTQTANDGRV